MPEILPVRELYCPSHFGNFYEVAMRNEMRQVLAEAKFWGYTRYSDWFDTIDLSDVYASDHRHFDTPEAVWARKFMGFEVAAELGLELGLVVTPNHVFCNQVTPANEATKSDRFFGHLVCPSKPGVAEMVLANYRNLFEDFARRGLRLTSISAGAYDYGGCACEACQPWIVAFGKLAKAIVQVGEEVFGTVQADLWGWWWTDEDHEAFGEWADREAPGRFHAFANHILYGEASYQVRRLPEGVSERAFVHIGYGEAPGVDTYGHYGAVVAPRRLEATYRHLVERGADGFLAYSEDVFDEINKAIMGGLASGQFASADAALCGYANRYLGGDAEGWADWLAQLGRIEALPAGPARSRFNTLKADSRPSERLTALELKLQMREADEAVRGEGEWTPDRIRAADAFFAAKEKLWRGIWRRGLCRHIFRFDWKVPEWYSGYAQATKATRIQSAESGLDQV